MVDSGGNKLNPFPQGETHGTCVQRFKVIGYIPDPCLSLHNPFDQPSIHPEEDMSGLNFHAD